MNPIQIAVQTALRGYEKTMRERAYECLKSSSTLEEKRDSVQMLQDEFYGAYNFAKTHLGVDEERIYLNYLNFITELFKNYGHC